MMLQICPLTPFLFGFSYSYAVTTLVHLKVQKYTYSIYALYTHTCTMWLAVIMILPETIKEICKSNKAIQVLLTV